MGYCIASDRITVDGEVVGYMIGKREIIPMIEDGDSLKGVKTKIILMITAILKYMTSILSRIMIWR